LCVFYCGGGDWSQVLKHARQEVYHWAPDPNRFLFPLLLL
jgi:hypothetical protein